MSASPEPPALEDDPLLASIPRIDEHPVVGSCVLRQHIAEGGFGTVFEAWHIGARAPMAVKLLRTSGLEEDQRAESILRFQREGRTLLGLAHENLVAFRDMGEVAGTHFLVMEFVDGCSVRGLVEQLGRPLSLAEALPIFLGAARGLAHAHERGVVHRDVKPGNLMLREDGVVKVVDLGLAKGPLSGTSRAHSGRPMGSPEFMPPEQWAGLEWVDERGDVWALGATLLWMLSGVATRGVGGVIPLESCASIDELPAEVRGLIERCVGSDPAARYPDAGALLEDAQALNAEHGGELPALPTPSRALPAPAPELLRRLRRGLGRRRAWSGWSVRPRSLVAGLALGLGLGLYALWPRDEVALDGERLPPSAAEVAAAGQELLARLEGAAPVRDGASAYRASSSEFLLADAYLEHNPELAELVQTLRRRLADGESVRGLCLVTAPGGVGKSPLFRFGLAQAFGSEDYEYVDARRRIDERGGVSRAQLVVRTDAGDALELDALPRLPTPPASGARDQLTELGLSAQPRGVVVIDSLDEVDAQQRLELLWSVHDRVRDAAPESGDAFYFLVGRKESLEAFWQRDKDPVDRGRPARQLFDAAHGRVCVLPLNFPDFHTPEQLDLLWRSQARFVDDAAPLERFLEGVSEHAHVRASLVSLSLVEYTLELAPRYADPRGFSRALLHELLRRGTGSHGRPSLGSAHTARERTAYFDLLEEIAKAYIAEAAASEEPSFFVRTDDRVQADGLEPVRVLDVLDLSALATYEPEPGGRRYRFQPAWLQWVLATDGEWRTP